MLSALRWVPSSIVIALLVPDATSTVAPLSVTPSTKWYGDDGTWSAISIRVGSPPQWLDVMVSMGSSETWVVGTGGCSDNTLCASDRGGLFNLTQSTSWVSQGYYDLGLDPQLNFTGYADYGLDTLTFGTTGVTIPSSIIGSITTSDYELGFFGVGNVPGNFKNSTYMSPISSLVETEGVIPSHSYGFTAGATYQQKGETLSLTLGGYDANRMLPHNISFELNPSMQPQTYINSISVGSAAASNNWTTPVQLLSTADRVSALIDSSTPYLWLPESVCDRFAQTLGLAYNSSLDLYTFDDDSTQHDVLQNSQLTFTFSLTDLASPTTDLVNITLPYAAFDLQLTFPAIPNTTYQSPDASKYYFPLRKAATEAQYTIGRAFLQEAYIITNYDANNFSIHQAIHVADPIGNLSLVSIPRSSNSHLSGNPVSSKHGISTGAIVGIVVGIVVFLVFTSLTIFLLLRRGVRPDNTSEEEKSYETQRRTLLDRLRRRQRPPILHEAGGNSAYPTEVGADVAHERFELPAPLGPAELDSELNTLAGTTENASSTQDSTNMSAYERARRKIERLQEATRIPETYSTEKNEADVSPIAHYRPLDMREVESPLVSPICGTSGDSTTMSNGQPSPVSPAFVPSPVFAPGPLFPASPPPPTYRKLTPANVVYAGPLPDNISLPQRVSRAMEPEGGTAGAETLLSEPNTNSTLGSRFTHNQDEDTYEPGSISGIGSTFGSGRLSEVSPTFSTESSNPGLEEDDSKFLREDVQKLRADMKTREILAPYSKQRRIGGEDLIHVPQPAENRFSFEEERISGEDREEPIEASSHLFTNTDSPSTPAPSNHGILYNHLHPAELLSPLHGQYEESSPAIPSSEVRFESESQRPPEHLLHRLSLANNAANRPKPSFQQISEYENALSPSSPQRQSEGPGFKIVKKKGLRLDGPQLDAFPNEVLTHILSHLSATSLAAVSLVSRRFYALVTTPHAWRVAFSRFFPGQDVVEGVGTSIYRRGSDQESRDNLRSEQRFFSRLTALASWRSEYILRTRLLRSLGRGKPAQIAPGHGASPRTNSAANNANAVITYSSQLFATINHIHAVFGGGKKSPRFIHGTDETGSASTSDPNIGKVDNWGLSDVQALPQFSELFAGDSMYGFGDGPTGAPNVMSLSQPFGMIYGEGFPGGQAYFRSPEELRGRFLDPLNNVSKPELGIPDIPSHTEAISAVWIAKSNSVSVETNGLVGMMAGSTFGIITAYSLGADTPHGRRIQKGQVTARWVISPGVPIIAIEVDESYNPQRKASGRLWAVALNALGEVFYLTETPNSVLLDAKLDDSDTLTHAWKTGRSVYWNLVELTRRVAREDPYHEVEIHGSYSPRSSSQVMNLAENQVIAETHEIEKFIRYRPSHFRRICEGWDMRRKLEVDFAGDDGNGAGEGIFVITCGVTEEEQAKIRRYSRWKTKQSSLEAYPMPKTPPVFPKTTTLASLFGGGIATTSPKSKGSPMIPSSPTETRHFDADLVEEWRTSTLWFGDMPRVEILTSGVDMSSYAILTIDEDPLQTVNGNAESSSPFASPSDPANSSTYNIPGHRARFLAVGTKSGSVMMWNMRGPQSTNPMVPNELRPLGVIQTDSPQITCLGVSSLFIIHGGNDGLVQAWDPLASTLQPIRTLNSRFSSRARRRLAQAEASIHGVGINLYAAGAIAIDPDPTVLRGMVSLGTHLRYWSYSSSAADQYQSKKRRLRRSGERGSNGGPDRYTNTGRGALMDYIATEQEELRQEKQRRSREEARLRGRFGVGLGGLSDEEALRYAEMVSAEAFQKDEERRMSDTNTVAGESPLVQGSWSSDMVTPEGSTAGLATPPRKYVIDDEFDHDLEEAIRLSLLEGVDSGGRSPKANGSGDYDIPITYKQKKTRRSASSSPSTSKASKSRVRSRVSPLLSNNAVAADDLEYALQLSLAEERSRAETPVDPSEEEYPSLETPYIGKGKGRAN